ncbi:hypothetical protein, partial [Paenibacillus riograndensis]
FIPSTFYHYRRDNAGSSMNSPKGFQYDLQESQYIVDWVMNFFPEDHARIRTVSRAVATICLNSLLRAVFYDNPNTHTIVWDFWKLLKNSYHDGYLVQEDFSIDVWMNLRMFLEDLERFEHYIREKAEAEFRSYFDFLSQMASPKQVVIFGCGKIGMFANFFMGMNGISNITCFCDNDSNKWGSLCLGNEVLSPQEAVAAYPHAYYLIANRANSMDISAQLTSMNISPNNIGIYYLPLNPIISTSRFLNKH